MRGTRLRAPRRRRRQRPWNRQYVEALRNKTAVLRKKDRSLMRMYLDTGASFRQIARIAGLNEVTVARRIHSVTRRLAKGAYLECVRHGDRLSDEELEVAAGYYLRGLSMRRIADGGGISYHRVRKAVRKIEYLRRESWPDQCKQESSTTRED